MEMFMYALNKKQRLRVTQFFKSISNYKMRCECTPKPNAEER